MENVIKWIRNRIEDEWVRNGFTRYTDALIDVKRYIEEQKVVLPQADVIKSVCVCGRELDAMDLQVAQCYECGKVVPQTVL